MSTIKKNVKRSVTCFLHCGDHYLFVHRSSDRDIDANRLNGIGGKLEYGEDYLSAAIRETEEETGYIVNEKDCQLSAVANLTGGYEDDWVMCFFKISVPHLHIPRGTENEEGQLIWLHKDEVLSQDRELVDDLNYCFNDIVQGNKILFMGMVLDDNEKIEKLTIKILS